LVIDEAKSSTNFETARKRGVSEGGIQYWRKNEAKVRADTDSSEYKESPTCTTSANITSTASTSTNSMVTKFQNSRTNRETARKPGLESTQSGLVTTEEGSKQEKLKLGQQ
jgi:hypothetical protein